MRDQEVLYDETAMVYGLWVLSQKMMIGDKKDHKEEPQHYPVISGPTDVKREMHIGFNPATGKFEVSFICSLKRNYYIWQLNS